MAENTQATNPFAKVFSEMAAPWCGTLKQAVAQYLESSEKWAEQALELNEQATTWAKDTPFAPLFETQRSLARQIMESSTTLARQLWQIEARAEEEAA
jgi:hypothetical protein